ncbi:MAG TPA: fucose isomerase [Planctomycetota bacterium]|nr:fucose isomerase [Planctomycetota bacterium]
MKTRISIFWPGDYRALPNKWALPQIEEATRNLERALKKLGRTSRRIPGFITRPDEALRKLGPVDDPMIGVFVHWAYGPHTTDGVVGKESPLLLASNFSGAWPGLVALLNTGACLASLGRSFSRVWTPAPDWTKDSRLLGRLEEWCTSGRIRYREDELSGTATVSPAAKDVADAVVAGIRKRRVLALMLGDTSMGMINGYFGSRVLARIGFTEHKVDQAWIIHRMKSVSMKRVDDAFRLVTRRGVQFHWREKGAEDFTEEATREQLRMYLAVLDLVKEFRADSVGWQYQLGLLPLLPPSDFCEGLLNSACRPESDGNVIITATEADQGNLVPMEIMKRILQRKRLHPAVFFHDVRSGGTHDGRWLWVLLNSGSCGAYAFNHDPRTLKGVHSYRQPAGYFPLPGGTFAGESLPGKVTWARAYLRGEELWMDIGRGEVVKLPPRKRDAWWEGTTRQWPFMAADLGCSQETVMAHYMSNHIAVAYGDIFEEMAAVSQALGFKVRVMASA